MTAERERDYYEMLGVERGADDAAIKRAFRKLAQQWHPDVNTDAEAQERFKEINEAYQVLSDPQRRQQYDMFGRAGVNGGGGGGNAGFEGAGFGGFSDIFDAFFGGSMAGAARRARPQPGSDLRYDLRITFEEAVLGTEKEIEFPVLGRCDTCSGSGAKPGTQPVECPQCKGRGELRSIRQTMLGQMVSASPCPRCRGEGKIVETPCETCHGEGRTERRRSDAGRRSRRASTRATRSASRTRARSAPAAARPASSTSRSTSTDHPELTREGTELYFEADLSIAQATLGHEDPRPDGRGRRHARSRSSPARSRAPRSASGAAASRTSAAQSSRGDLHVIANVVVPTKLTKKQRELLEAFAKESGDAIAEHQGLREKLGLG